MPLRAVRSASTRGSPARVAASAINATAASASNSPDATISPKRHAALKDAGLVHEQKRGQFVIYSVAADHLVNTLYGFLTPFCPDARRISAERKRRAKMK
jgi:DNA-binding transcriptional ArsR family regulator